MRKLGLFDDDVLIGENDGFLFYETSWTQSLTEEARRMDLKGIELRRWRVVLAQSKKDASDRIFLLINDKGAPVADDTSAESMSFKIKLIKMNMAEGYDIVEMAEKANEAKRKKKKVKK